MKNPEPQILEAMADEPRKNVKAMQTSGNVKSDLTTFGYTPTMMNNSVSTEGVNGEYAFDATEQKIILLTASTANKFLYCIAAHSGTHKDVPIHAEIVKAIRNKEQLGNEKLNALVGFTREIVAKHGLVSESSKARFINVGYSEIALMDMLADMALKTINNFLDHLMLTPIDGAIQV
jgi:alkylhydroperoxidase family enzyme